MNDPDVNRDPLVDYGDTDDNEEEEDSLEDNGNNQVNTMNNNVEEEDNKNASRRMNMNGMEEGRRRMAASCFMLPYLSGESSNECPSTSSDQECETSCENSTNDDEDTDGGHHEHEHEHAPVSFTPMHWLSRLGSNGNEMKTRASKMPNQALDIFDDNATDGCDEDSLSQKSAPPILTSEQVNDFRSFSESRRSRLRDTEAQEFDLRAVLGNRVGKESVPFNDAVPERTGFMDPYWDPAWDELEVVELRRRIQSGRDWCRSLTREKEENQMNLKIILQKKKELEEELDTLSQNQRYFEENKRKIQRNIALNDLQISKDKNELLNKMRSLEKANRDKDIEDVDRASEPSVSVTVRNSSLEDPRSIPLFGSDDSVRNVNVDRMTGTFDALGPIFSQNINFNVITKPEHSKWKTMDEKYFLEDDGRDFFEYLNQHRVNVLPNNGYHCQICDVKVKGKITLWSHLRGKKHGANLRDDHFMPKDKFSDEKTYTSLSSDLRHLLKRKRECFE